MIKSRNKLPEHVQRIEYQLSFPGKKNFKANFFFDRIGFWNGCSASPSVLFFWSHGRLISSSRRSFSRRIFLSLKLFFPSPKFVQLTSWTKETPIISAESLPISSKSSLKLENFKVEKISKCQFSRKKWSNRETNYRNMFSASSINFHSQEKKTLRPTFFLTGLVLEMGARASPSVLVFWGHGRLISSSRRSFSRRIFLSLKPFFPSPKFVQLTSWTKETPIISAESLPISSKSSLKLENFKVEKISKCQFSRKKWSNRETNYRNMFSASSINFHSQEKKTLRPTFFLTGLVLEMGARASPSVLVFWGHEPIDFQQPPVFFSEDFFEP